MLTAEKFLSEIDAFLKRSGMSATAFGREALNDPSFVHDLRNGRKPNLGVVSRVGDFMRNRTGKKGAAA
jgi:2,4-dienoyl-CoA reductase-like NADH-dependent reductase (Old Yellow Enzyme family)